MWQFLAVRLHRDENASTMVVALASMVFLILALAFPLNLGWNISERIRLQNAADAAAYSAAITEADALSAIAWINNMEAYLYHREIMEVKKYCEFATDAAMFTYGNNSNRSFDDACPIQDADTITQANKWYKKFHDKFGADPDAYFKDQIVNKDMKFVIDMSTKKRTCEIWIRTLSKAAEAIAVSMPRMIRNEASRIAFKNLGSDALVAVFPSDAPVENSPVFMNFKPNKTASSYATEANFGKTAPRDGDGNLNAVNVADQSFMEYAPWYQSYKERESHGTDIVFYLLGKKYEDTTNPLVERAIQYGDQMSAKYVTNHKVYLPSVDMPAHMMGFGIWENWYDVYRGEPRQRMNISMQFVPKEMYMGYARTLECWQKTDRDEDESGGDGMQGQAHPGNNKPKGHWHHYHLHIHYWCFSILNIFPFWEPPSYHIGPIPWFHRDCNEESRDCDMSWRRWGPKANGVIPIHQWFNTIPLPIDHIMDFVSYIWFDIFLPIEDTPPPKLAANPGNDGKYDGKWLGDLSFMDSMPFLYMFPEAAIQNLMPNLDHHHCIKACPVCWNHFTGAFNRSWAPHALEYGMLDSVLNHPMLHPLMLSFFGWDDHNWNVSERSQVRCYLEDALTDYYLHRSVPDIDRNDNLQKILRDNFCPDITTYPEHNTKEPMTGLLTPIIVLKDRFDRSAQAQSTQASEQENYQHFFQWGIIVAVWNKQISPWLPDKVFKRKRGLVALPEIMDRPGMLAVSASKVGIIQRIPFYYSDSGTDRYFPNRLITGIDEPYDPGDDLATAPPGNKYSAKYMLDTFIKPNKKEQQMVNLFQTNWGARLIPIDKSIPRKWSNDNNTTPLELVLKSKAYMWPPLPLDAALLAGGAIAIPNIAKPWSTGMSKADYKKLSEILCH